MTEKEEQFIHFTFSINALNHAWSLLKLINQQSENPLRGAAFRFAIIEYSKPYKYSNGQFKPRFKLNTKFIPNDFLSLHQSIILSRDQIQAHSDLTIRQAKLSMHEFESRRYAQIVENKITGLEDLSKINEIISLIEATLDNMYVEVKILEAEL